MTQFVCARRFAHIPPPSRGYTHTQPKSMGGFLSIQNIESAMTITGLQRARARDSIRYVNHARTAQWPAGADAAATAWQNVRECTFSLPCTESNLQPTHTVLWWWWWLVAAGWELKHIRSNEHCNYSFSFSCSFKYLGHLDLQHCNEYVTYNTSKQNYHTIN